MRQKTRHRQQKRIPKTHRESKKSLRDGNIDAVEQSKAEDAGEDANRGKMPTASPFSRTEKQASNVSSTVRIARGSSFFRLTGITPQRVSNHRISEKRKSRTVATKLILRGTDMPMTKASVIEFGWFEVNRTEPLTGIRSR